VSAATGKRIVVGVDGSATSIHALQWAVRQAGLTGATVDAVCAWQFPVSYGWAVTDNTDYAALAAETLEKAIAEVRQAGETTEIQGHVVEQNAAQALIDASRGADLLVVGSRGHGGFTGALLGSVSNHCVHHATCPVVVIRDGKH
jgi:nucleotide-binding universal stress UspA family protein